LRFFSRYGFFPPPYFSDLSGYETMLDVITRYRLWEVPGDIVEIGAFLGGGTYKLCRFYELRSPAKKIYSIDLFDPGSDVTRSLSGTTMHQLYASRLQGKNQRAIFDHITHSCSNLVVLSGDSRAVTLPCPVISFAYIDGNHSSEYVAGDFSKVWDKLSPAGVVAFDDYGFDLPGVTETVHHLIGLHGGDIEKVFTADARKLFIVRKGECSHAH
jgi:hypothetical protein